MLLVVLAILTSDVSKKSPKDLNFNQSFRNPTLLQRMIDS